MVPILTLVEARDTVEATVAMVVEVDDQAKVVAQVAEKEMPHWRTINRQIVRRI